MAIGITEEHGELAASMRSWAASLDGPAAARGAEGDPAATFADLWKEVVAMGVPGIAVAEERGGAGGSVLDLAVVLEACATELVPGPLLTTAVASVLLGSDAAGRDLADGEVVSVALPRPDGDVLTVPEPGAAGRLLLPGPASDWHLVPADAVSLDPVAGPDLGRRYAPLAVETAAGATAAAGSRPVPGLSSALVRRTAVTLAAAEASGVARWCLATAVEHAGVREQFGRKIGSFQAVKHLCARMLETAEAVTAAAWDAAVAADAVREEDSQDAWDQWDFSVEVAATTCFDGAVEVAKACIQVLGGIGFTWEHDAHLYLRRALALRAEVGSSERAAAALAGTAVAGRRRRVRIALEGYDDVRPRVRATAEEIGALPVDRRRAALAETGFLVPHWPRPHGLDADPGTQLVIDEELARAGVERPDLVIAGWALPTLLAHGTPEQQQRFIGPSLRGDLVWCQLFSEPEAGSDLASLRTRAVRVDGGWRLTGQKVWTSLADRADWAIALARTDPDAPQHRGITYFLVDMRSSGLDVRPLREITGEALFNEVFLDDVLVPDDCVVGEVNGGWRLARTTLANERVAMASARLGTSVERAVELAGRDGSGGTAVGRAVALATVCGLLGVRTTLRSLAGRGPGPESSVAKLLGVRSRQDAAELVVALHGDRALWDAQHPEVAADLRELLNTRCLSIAGGTTEVLRNVAAERILGLPR